MAYEDIEELQDLIHQAESDEEWYVAGIVLAAADVTAKTLSVIQQTAAIGTTSWAAGFNAGLHLDIEATKTETNSNQTTSLASSLSGQNISINAGKADGNQALLQGSQLNAAGDVSIDAFDVNIFSLKRHGE